MAEGATRRGGTQERGARLTMDVAAQPEQEECVRERNKEMRDMEGSIPANRPGMSSISKADG